MSFPDHPPPLPNLPPPPFANRDFGHKRAMDNGDMDSDPHLNHSQALKKPRNSMKNNPQSDPPNFPRTNPPNPPNRGTGSIFYKTRMCLKFLDGICRNAENCTFAHGADDLREPPPNWQEIVGYKENVNGYDDQRSGNRFKICKKYANGEECPYGESCNFLHKRGGVMMSSDAAEVDERRESSVIRISTNTNMPMMGMMNGSSQIEAMNNNIDNKVVNINQNFDAYRVNMKPAYWKTKLCSRWEAMGYCPFGEKCHYAHGHADLKMPGAQIDAEVASILSYNPVPKPVSAPPTTAADINTVLVAPIDNGVEKFREKWKGPKKINGIYGDWLDDMEPPLMWPKNDNES